MGGGRRASRTEEEGEEQSEGCRWKGRGRLEEEKEEGEWRKRGRGEVLKDFLAPASIKLRYRNANINFGGGVY